MRSLVGMVPRGGGAAMAMSSLASIERYSEGQLLPATEDEHDGILVEMQRPIEAQAFSSLLKSSISHWTQLGKRGVWLKLPIEHSNLVDAAVKEGFYYHHAEESYLMLARWLPETENVLPLNASHRVGVGLGAFVINEKKEVVKHRFLAQVPGDGTQIVECVCLLALEQKAFHVDTHAARVMIRLGWTPIPPLLGG